MAADDRELRDRLEQLQVRTKALRAQLDAPGRLDEVRVEVAAQVQRLKHAHTAALAQLTTVKAEAEDARMRSMAAKRERAELGGSASSTMRVALGISAALSAAIAGAHFASPGSGLHVPGAVAACLGACGFVALVYRMASDLRRP